MSCVLTEWNLMSGFDVFHNGNVGTIAEMNAEQKTEDVERITIDVGGTIFTLTRSSIGLFPMAKLATMVDDFENFDMETGIFYVDRNPDMANLIFDVYRYGSMHVPTSICGNAVLEELKFWRLPEDVIANCCVGGIMEDIDKLEAIQYVHETFESSYKDVEYMMAKMPKGIHRLKLNAWVFLEYPMHNKWSKVSTILRIKILTNCPFQSFQYSELEVV